MRWTFLLLLCLVVTAVFAKGGVEQDDDDDEYDTVEVQRQQSAEGLANPCNTHKCNRGEVCILDGDNARCECQTCDEEVDEEASKVCSTKNVTYDTECTLDRDHCLCKTQQNGCSNPKLQKIRLDYYGACKELEACPRDAAEFKEFPLRMRDWFFRIMRELANRSELDEYLDLLEAAQNDDTHADAVLWKFCDLDIHPSNSAVTRRELMYIIASIKPMEKCLVPFLNFCDEDNDNSISLYEWGKCLDLEPDHIKNVCKPIHDNRKG